MSYPVASDVPKLSEKDLKQWKLIADFRQRLETLSPGLPEHPSWQDQRRRLQHLDYLSLFLMALVNPVVKTTRAICAASQLQRVQAEICSHSVSLGSFSAAQHLLDPILLEKLITSLSEQIQGPKPTHPKEAWQVWLARDSSIFPALKNMVWAQYGGGKVGHPNHAVRFHVSFHLLEDKPTQVQVTPGKVCERKVWREHLESGATYVGDRYFGQDYKMFARLQSKGCQFVLRLRDEAAEEVEADNFLTPEDQAAGVLKDQWVRLGSRERYRTERLRMITVRKPSGTLMRLITNIPAEQMTGAQILTLYGKRWQIECFFRWIKCLLGCRHWLAQSQAGVTMQLYLAVIVGLMLQLVLGRRPNQRLWERVQLYLMGWATLDELMVAVEAALAKAKKSSK